MSLLAFGTVAQRLARLQLGQGAALAASALANRTDNETIAAGRGVIFDRNGIEVALSVPQTTVWADPRSVAGHVPETVAALAPILGIDPAALTATLSQSTRKFVYVARQVPDTVAQQVHELLDQTVVDAAGRKVARFPGVATFSEPTRFYPAGEVGRSVIGLTDIDGRGISGVESSFETALKGQPGELRREVDQQGRTIPAGRTDYAAPTPGSDLELTVDVALQYQVEQALLARVVDLGAKGGTVIVMEPGGDILAMATVASPAPAADAPADAPPPAPRLSRGNGALVFSYEPGSVNKVITAAAAIESGLAAPSTELDVPAEIVKCEGTSDRKIFKNHGAVADQKLPLATIIAESSNTGTIGLADQVGQDRLYRYMKAFGLGSKTALNFTNEASGRLFDKNSCTGLATAAIGQGVSVTPMQMALVYATIANKGTYQPPRLVAATVDGNGHRHAEPRSAGHRVVSEQTARSVTEILTEVVSGEHGTGARAAIDGYQVAGKTGTAQKPQSGGGYLDLDGNTHYYSSFVGFAPADDPRVVVAVAIDDPATTNEHYYASYAAAPLFRIITQDALRTMRVARNDRIIAPKVSDQPTAGDLADAGR